MSASPRVRVAVIGAGAWARVCHLPVLRARPEVDLVAVCDVDPDRAVAAAEEFGVARALSDWSLVFDDRIDACVVASPAAAHYEQAAAALAHGAHVLIEKPMVLRAAEADALVAQARDARRELVVSFGWNYSDIYTRARELMSDPGIGRVEHMIVHMASGTRELLTGVSTSSAGVDGPAAVSSTWTDPVRSGGGYGQAQLPHALGVALGITGETVITVDAVSGGAPGPVETCLAASGRLGCGASLALSGASFHAGLAENRHQLEVRVFGSEGNLVVDFERDELRLLRPDRTITVDLPPGAGRYDGTGPAHALVDIAAGLAQCSPSSGELGARTVGALERIYAGLDQ